MLHIEPGHAGLACHQLLAIGPHYGSNVGLTDWGLVCILLGDLVGDVDHGREGGKGWMGVIPAYHSAQHMRSQSQPVNAIVASMGMTMAKVR